MTAKRDEHEAARTAFLVALGVYREAMVESAAATAVWNAAIDAWAAARVTWDTRQEEEI